MYFSNKKTLYPSILGRCEKIFLNYCIELYYILDSLIIVTINTTFKENIFKRLYFNTTFNQHD